VSATTEPVTGLLTRKAFVDAGEVALAESYRRAEPVAILIVAVEGLRVLDDAGRWAHCNALIGQAGQVLALRCRANDLLARFDESRFVMLLRRVDRELAALIAAELVNKLNAIDLSDIEAAEGIVFRGGLGVSGDDGNAPLADLVAQAVQNCHDARRKSEWLGTGPAVTTDGANA
jgi:GGDEF domain-containing protein